MFQAAFRVGSSTRLDERVFAMEQCKTMPTAFLMLHLYPDLYPVHVLDEKVRTCLVLTALNGPIPSLKKLR